MHDLNDALDELRSVIPYATAPSVRKLSKIATLLLAKNHILMQANALEELRRIIAYMNQTAGIPIPTAAIAAAFAEQQNSSSTGVVTSPILSPNSNNGSRDKGRSPLGVSSSFGASPQSTASSTVNFK